MNQSDDDGTSSGEAWIVANEFARVRLSIDRNGHDPRLLVEDLAEGRSILLDALTLACLAREHPDNLACHLFPNRDENESGTNDVDE